MTKALPNSTNEVPILAEMLETSDQPALDLNLKLSNTPANMEVLSIADLETHLSKHLNNEDDTVQLLRNRLAANEKEDHDLAILSSILLRRYELRAEKEKLDGMIKLFIHE